MGGILLISLVFNWIKVKLVSTLCLVMQGGVSSPISPYRAALQRNLKNVGMSWEWRHGWTQGRQRSRVCLLVFCIINYWSEFEFFLNLFLLFGRGGRKQHIFG